MRTIVSAGIALACCASAMATANGAPSPVKASAAALTTADFPDATVKSETPTATTFIPLPHASSAYTRTFSSFEFDRKQVVLLSSAVEVAPSTAKAHAAISVFANPAARKEILHAVQAGSTGRLLRYRRLSTGDDTIDIAFALVENRQALGVGVLFIQVGPVVETVLYASRAPALSAGAAVNLAKLAVARIKAASAVAPANTALPTIAGTPQLGQILTAKPGTWTGPPPAFMYQWFRCNSAGAACVTIVGQTQTTYTPSTADQGLTVAVSVAATTAAGTTVAMSLPTALVA